MSLPFATTDWEKVAALLLWRSTRGRRPLTIRKPDVEQFAAARWTMLVTSDVDSLQFHLLTPDELAALKEHQHKLGGES